MIGRVFVCPVPSIWHALHVNNRTQNYYCEHLCTVRQLALQYLFNYLTLAYYPVGENENKLWKTLKNLKFMIRFSWRELDVCNQGIIDLINMYWKRLSQQVEEIAGNGCQCPAQYQTIKLWICLANILSGFTGNQRHPFQTLPLWSNCGKWPPGSVRHRIISQGIIYISMGTRADPKPEKMDR